MKRARQPNNASLQSMTSLWFDLLLLGIESQQVIALRLAKIARGGRRARQESSRMVTEKAKAGMRAGYQVLRGDPASQVIRGYRAKTRANLRRLTK